MSKAANVYSLHRSQPFALVFIQSLERGPLKLFGSCFFLFFFSLLSFVGLLAFTAQSRYLILDERSSSRWAVSLYGCWIAELVTLYRSP